jgi:hypothetical protein
MQMLCLLPAEDLWSSRVKEERALMQAESVRRRGFIGLEREGVLLVYRNGAGLCAVLEKRRSRNGLAGNCRRERTAIQLCDLAAATATRVIYPNSDAGLSS